MIELTLESGLILLSREESQNIVNSLIDLSRIFFPYCAKEEKRIIDSNLDFAYYGSLDTIFKILDKKELWLRNIRCMNDHKELLFGYNILKNLLYNKTVIRNRLIDALALIKIKDRCYWEQFLNTIWEDESVLLTLGKYINIICFTEHDNTTDINGRLEMFNSYGRNNGGCLVFKGKEVLKAGAELSKVLYVEDENDPKLMNSINMLIDSLNNNRSILLNSSLEVIERYLSMTILYGIISIKHVGFSYEREWRLIASGRINTQEQNPYAYVDNCKPECLNGVPQLVYKYNLTGREYLLKQIIIENKFEAFEECMCLSYLLHTKWGIKDEEDIRNDIALKMLRISEIPIIR